jgi:hypothetical protein
MGQPDRMSPTTRLPSARITAAEFILIVFRINEHLGAIRDQGQMR